MIEWRPVDCDTRAPLRVSPAYIDKSTIYKGGPRPGWAWFPQEASAATLITPLGQQQAKALMPAVFGSCGFVSLVQVGAHGLPAAVWRMLAASQFVGL